MTDATSPEPEPERFRNKSRVQLERWIDSLTIESQRHRAGKKYWKHYALTLERKLDAMYNETKRV